MDMIIQNLYIYAEYPCDRYDVIFYGLHHKLDIRELLNPELTDDEFDELRIRMEEQLC